MHLKFKPTDETFRVWRAESLIGQGANYEINLTNEGAFSVEGSTCVLIPIDRAMEPDSLRFASFDAAVEWCNELEKPIINDLIELYKDSQKKKAASLELHTAESGSGWVYKSNLPNCRFLYMVFTTVDGLFDVNHTSVELRGPAVVEQFSSLALAKAWCEARDALLTQQN